MSDAVFIFMVVGIILFFFATGFAVFLLAIGLILFVISEIRNEHTTGS